MEMLDGDNVECNLIFLRGIVVKSRLGVLYGHNQMMKILITLSSKVGKHYLRVFMQSFSPHS